ncbi:MAG: ZIP family metal transporter [Halobacteriota archaeon]
MVLDLIIISALLVSILSFVGILTLSLSGEVFQRILLLLVAFSAGALMGGAFIHLMPESLEKIEPLQAFVILLIGFSSFFLLERLLMWRHCHKHHCEVHPFTYLNLVGDGLHNFIDGVIIAAGYLTSVPVGIVATFAVAAHEIPQELGDFAVLVYGGFSKMKALLFNFVSAITAIAGALIAYFLLLNPDTIVLVLPFAAGNFLYIASSDLIPELHKEASLKRSFLFFVMFVIGISLMYSLKMTFGAD